MAGDKEGTAAADRPEFFFIFLIILQKYTMVSKFTKTNLPPP
jgi:hypothetical protein